MSYKKADVSSLYTINNAKKWIADNIDEGCICPACNKIVKRYKRPITSSMSRLLVSIQRHQERVNQVGYWFHLNTMLQTLELNRNFAGDFSKFRHWEVIEALDAERSDGNPHTGHYRLTDLGIKFAKNQAKLQKYILEYNGVLYGHEGTYTSIIESLGNHFKYDEL